MAGERKQKRLVVANWKMNPATLADAARLWGEARKSASRAARLQTVVCAPFIYLAKLSETQTARCALGAQDCYFERSGAYTGEVSPSQLVSLGVRYVILGHSERREMGETNALIARKVLSALKEGLVVILCVGERARDEDGQYLTYIKQQIEESLRDIPRRYFLNLIVTYEPVWAISTYATGVESSGHMLEMNIFIRKTLGAICGKDLAVKIPILYGGSVDEKNVASFIEQGGADGVLTGKNSLLPETLHGIVKAINAIKND